jgi:hypothetical protein
VLAAAPASVDARRPIRVFAYASTPRHANPIVPELLVDLFGQERAAEPHVNPLLCTRCGHSYSTPSMEDQSCSQVHSRPCDGVIRREWDRARIQDALDEHLREGHMAVAWQLSEPAVPVAFAVCEVHRPDTLLNSIDFPMDVLQCIFPWAGREGPYFVISHLWLGGVSSSQQEMLLKDLIKKTVEGALKREELTQASILVPVDSRYTEPRHQLLKQWLVPVCQYRELAVDERHGRHHSLLGFKLGTVAD